MGKNPGDQTRVINVEIGPLASIKPGSSCLSSPPRTPGESNCSSLLIPPGIQTSQSKQSPLDHRRGSQT